jgi:hypothetical protein
VHFQHPVLYSILVATALRTSCNTSSKPFCLNALLDLQCDNRTYTRTTHDYYYQLLRSPGSAAVQASMLSSSGCTWYRQRAIIQPRVCCWSAENSEIAAVANSPQPNSNQRRTVFADMTGTCTTAKQPTVAPPWSSNCRSSN